MNLHVCVQCLCVGKKVNKCECVYVKMCATADEIVKACIRV